MTRTSPPNTPPMAHSVYEHGYERLRRHAVDSGAEPIRHGLGVVARRGVAAWLHVFAELPAPPPEGHARGPCEMLPAAVHAPLIDIVLAMIKGHMGREPT